MSWSWLFCYKDVLQPLPKTLFSIGEECFNPSLLCWIINKSYPRPHKHDNAQDGLHSWWIYWWWWGGGARWNMTTMLQSQMQHSMCPIPSHCSILLNSAPRSPHVQRSRPTLQRICKAERGGARTASHDLGSSRDLGMVHLVFGMVIFPRLVKLVFWMVLVLHIVWQCGFARTAKNDAIPGPTLMQDLLRKGLVIVKILGERYWWYWQAEQMKNCATGYCTKVCNDQIECDNGIPPVRPLWDPLWAHSPLFSLHRWTGHCQPLSSLSAISYTVKSWFEYDDAEHCFNQSLGQHPIRWNFCLPDL